ncbi:2,3-diaminopropionate biosynthesis protein SbnA [Tumebacillus algifaecis]|uniref:2,3-diaminopropionate biosynthesis protein SbnA n=1 Tax=Tumebacillus algifaecis TaxID=1214604 RepID=A0A223CXI8_9BACL|nr:2,3-diaminopropionate biosynthesis protein SbnA [Tumebacillus algifaecis]ASS74002.1 2,3-diaminopropionate biosynthesis protein SbnA [Tumebacillus algifaecis]
MLEKLKSVAHMIGHTPLMKLADERLDLYCKLEYHNLMGSVKVRPAYYILKEAIERGDVNQHTTIIESSSGNFAIALATLCRKIGIKFIPVIDPNINPSYENLLKTISSDVVKVTERDESGGFLLTRIETVNRLLTEIEDSFWTNQYGNPNNYRAHYHGLGTELADSFEQLDYAFIGVSSGGTITGISRRLKEKFPNVKIIAVDSDGSVIFGGEAKKRYIPGIGSSMRPSILDNALIDEVIYVPEVETIDGCHELYSKHGIFAGGSSGTSYRAVQQYFAGKMLGNRPTVAFLCPDGGMAYTDTVYNQEWVAWLRAQTKEMQLQNS